MFSTSLTASLSEAPLAGADIHSLGINMISQMPEGLRQTTLDVITDALHPIYIVVIIVAVTVFFGSRLLEELPLSYTIDAEEGEC